MSERIATAASILVNGAPMQNPCVPNPNGTDGTAKSRVLHRAVEARAFVDHSVEQREVLVAEPHSVNVSTRGRRNPLSRHAPPPALLR
ncbi:MAG: hypothetical protein M3548_11545 [Actinomycetota bacterium]|nr:hypothetical protein [Actinomycetota bacterium]